MKFYFCCVYTGYTEIQSHGCWRGVLNDTWPKEIDSHR